MEGHHQQIRQLLRRVRARWRRLALLQATVRTALAATGVLVGALVLASWTGRAPMALAAIGVVAAVLILGVLAWGLRPARGVPSDARVARFIEEREPSLDDRLVSAVDLGTPGRASDSPGLAAPMVADAGRRASAVDPAAIVSSESLRRAGFQAAAAALLLVAVALFGRGTARQAFDSLALSLFPSRVTLEVVPGSARIRAGSPLTIEARLVGNRAPVVARLLRAEADGAIATPGGDWDATEMTADAGGTFRLALESVGASFKYRVLAGSVASPVYDVSVVSPPRVTRIEVQYTYPPAFGLPPRTEQDGGDIYAPAGTDVRIQVHADREVSTGRMTLASGGTVTLTREPDGVLAASLEVAEDDSYRVALTDGDGLTGSGETEYFIRMLEDRPPEVRILKPARDRSVSPLEEVDIEAEAEDDFGVERLELVYAVRGGAEKAVPIAIQRGAPSVAGARTLYLEDLDVRPGDFVAYYVRARDLPRGRSAGEARSDIFFLEVKPFEQEFVLAQSQAMGGGNDRSVDDLVSAQKEIIVATWKLDRRSRAAGGARSEQDIKVVARAEAELKTRVEETSSSFRESTMRDPRRRGQPGALGAGQTLAEEDAMTAAAEAMGRAVTALSALRTADALPPEMEALNHLLKAQADVRKRQVTRQQAGSGGGNRASQDLSGLFDKELQRQQQTNYETPTATEERKNPGDPMLDEIKELARRQDELVRRQQELARGREAIAAEEMKRALETLTREQSELRRRAEEMARRMARRQNQSEAQGGRAGQQGQSSQQGQSGQQAGQGRGGQQGQGASGADIGRRMREVSEQMGNAANELRRQRPDQASSNGSQALDQLEQLARELAAAAPDERRRALGDMQLEARQLADAQRQVAAELGRIGPGAAGEDARQRLAGEQERLADRVRRLQGGLERQAAAATGGAATAADAGMQRAAGEAARELERQRLGDRMQQSAEQIRGPASAAAPGEPGARQANTPTAPAANREEMARMLDRVADRLAAANGPLDAESRRLTDQLARVQELREQIDSLTGELERLGQQGSAGQSATGQRSPGESAPEGQGAGGDAGGRDVARLQEEYTEQLRETRELLERLRREDASLARAGMGLTFEGQGMTPSAPGTESFKQDFAQWDQLRRQATSALELAEAALSRKLQARESRDRLAAGIDDKPPAGYEQQVDSYFKALATKKP